jgi:hypothetical protein
VLGHYERTSGGCDTISATDGGLDEVFRLADAWASAGHDVLFEGSAVSAEHERSVALARRHALHVLRLATPPEQAARNLVARRRARRDSWPLVAKAVVAQRAALEDACSKLLHIAAVEDLDFEDALRRARELLGYGPAAAAMEPVGSARLVGAARPLGAGLSAPASPPAAGSARTARGPVSPALPARWVAPYAGCREAGPDTKDPA